MEPIRRTAIIVSVDVRIVHQRRDGDLQAFVFQKRNVSKRPNPAAARPTVAGQEENLHSAHNVRISSTSTGFTGDPISNGRLATVIKTSIQRFRMARLAPTRECDK